MFSMVSNSALNGKAPVGDFNLFRDCESFVWSSSTCRYMDSYDSQHHWPGWWCWTGSPGGTPGPTSGLPPTPTNPSRSSRLQTILKQVLYRHLVTIIFYYHVSSSSATAKPDLCIQAWQFLEHSRRCYRYYDDRRSWQEARSMCQDAHKEGELASIPDR